MLWPLTTRICAVSLIAGTWIAEGRAAAQTTQSASPGVLWMGQPEPARDTSVSEVGLVLVEVVVTDQSHNPVTGLPAEAFHIEEDGLARPVLSFRAVDLPGLAIREPTKSEAPRVSTNAVDANAIPHRTFVIVFDDSHLGPAGALRARALTERFVTGHTRPGDRVILIAPEKILIRSAVMPDGRASLVTLASSLRARRQAAPVLTDYESFRIVENDDSTVEQRVLERLGHAGILPPKDVAPAGYGGSDRSAGDLQKDQIDYVRSEARQILEKARERRRRLLSSLAGVLEVLTTARTRKSVLLVSEGFIYDPRDPSTYDVIAASQRANAAVYFLDVRRLAVGSQPDGFEEPTAPGRSLSALRGESTGAEILATVTGGSVVQKLSDLDDALARLSAEADRHYILGYLPSGERRGGRLRRIHVEVDRPDVVVRARKGYWDAPYARRGPDHEPTATLDAALQGALGSPTLLQHIPLRLTALPLAPADGGRVEVAIVSEMSAGALSLERMPDGSQGATLDVVLDVRHVQPQASQLAAPETLSVRVAGDAPVEDTWLPFRRRVTLPPGLSQIKVVVRDRASGAIGTVAHQLEVPEAARLRTSSPILSDVPEGEGVKPPRIVAHRSFAAGSVLYCYFEVFPGPGSSSRESAEAMSAYEIVDSRGKVRLRAAMPLPVRGAGGGLGRLVEVPLARIEPGEYELVLDLAADVTGATGELREPFSVTRPPSFNDQLYSGALSAYLEGDFDRAVATLLRWPAKEILAAVQRLPHNGDRVRASALLLHTDLALLLRRHGLGKRAENHLDIARALVEDAAHSDLHREWLLALAYAHQERSHTAEALRFYTECVRAFPEAAEARLATGTLYERYAFLSDGFARGNLNLSPRRAARRAERSYREALRLWPALTEARLRLARVLQKTDRVDEALTQLSLVVESSQDASLSALAHLFWGEISETREDVVGAIEHYRAALAADRNLQVAALALAQALHRRHGRQAAVQALLPALAETGTSPWLAYRQGPLRLSRLHEMRSRLRAVALGPR